MRKRVLAGSLVFAAVVLACIASSQEPVRDIDPEWHPNLAAAQQLSRQAYDRLTAAQEAHEFELGGHASRAKELLREANEEIKLSAIVANHR